MKMKTLFAVIVAAVFAAPSIAQQHPGHDTQGVALTDGEVRKVDKDAQKITIKHGPIQNLDMPGHTMVVRVREPAMLDQVKPGDKVKVRIEKIGGAFTITRLEPAK